MSTVRGVVPGIVTSVDDPRGEGRGQIRFPDMPEIDVLPWAPVATCMAGNGRGTYLMPEKDDEVLVCFDRGNFDHPYIVGYLWNGVDTPPDEDIDPSVRRVRSVSGHSLDFDDRPGSEKIRIVSQGGHSIELDDAGSVIRILSTGGQSVTIDDGGPTLTIESGGNRIEMSSSGITLDAGMGEIKLNANTIKIEGLSTVDLSASGALTATGMPIWM